MLTCLRIASKAEQSENTGCVELMSRTAAMALGVNECMQLKIELVNTDNSSEGSGYISLVYAFVEDL